MAEVQQKKRISLPNDLDSTERLKVGRTIIRYILERTEEGLDVNGKKFANYSDSYSQSLDFKIAGKSQNHPNLRLTGDMLGAGFQVLEHGPGYVTIGFEAGTKENDKAAWAQASDNGPSRRFVGIDERVVDIIVAEIRTEIPGTIQELSRDEQIQKRVSQATSKQVTTNIIKNLGIDVEE